MWRVVHARGDSSNTRNRIVAFATLFLPFESVAEVSLKFVSLRVNVWTSIAELFPMFFASFYVFNAYRTILTHLTPFEFYVFTARPCPRKSRMIRWRNFSSSRLSSIYIYFFLELNFTQRVVQVMYMYTVALNVQNTPARTTRLSRSAVYERDRRRRLLFYPSDKTRQICVYVRFFVFWNVSRLIMHVGLFLFGRSLSDS